MAVINGTIKGVSLVQGNVNGVGSRKAYLLSCDFPAYTGAADTSTITGVGAAITASVKNGKTLTLRGGICVGPGADTANQAVYCTGTAVQAMTVSSDDLTGHLAVAAGTEITSTTATTGVQMIVVVDES
jgi:hypothetical protein